MLLEADKSSLLIIDVQEKLLPAMMAGNSVLASCQLLVACAQELGVPVTLSEQYPQGLGKTVGSLSFADLNPQIFEKLHFSCWRDPRLRAHLIRLHEVGRPQILLAGLETHVCLLQTALQLHQAGFAVYVAVEATASRTPFSYRAALDRLQQQGIQLVSVEMVVFEWLEKAGYDSFKRLSQLIR